MKFFANIFLMLLFNSSNCDTTDIVMIKSNGSEIVGRKMFTVLENRPYGAFYKIPYALPPVKELRFKPPKAHPEWDTKITYDFSKPYNDTCSYGFTEDCLYINVYTPLTDHKIYDFPVVVWIHEQSNLHEPDFFIDEGVLVVTVSYRTFILGFLNTGDDFAKGNMGAKDILMALRWVREKIQLFNGDISKVTVVASGSSANIVASFLLSVSAEDLFSRLIIQSGSALSPADYRKEQFEVLNKLYWKFYGSYDKFNRNMLYKILSNATIKELMIASEDLFDSSEVRNEQRLINSFGPTIELAEKHAFMNKSPIEVYRRGMANNDVDVMMGYTSLESLYKLKGFVKNRNLLRYLNYNFQYVLPFEGKPDEYGSRRYKKIRKKIMDFYFSNGTIGAGSLRRYAKYVSDQVIYPLLRQARLHAAASCNNVYLYRFSFKGSLNIAWSLAGNLNYSGATAGDEICYLFRCKSANDVYRSAETSAERQFIKKIARLWTNFAKYGNPTPVQNDSVLGGLQWKPISGGRFSSLSLGKKIKMADLPEEKRMKFWDDLMKEFFLEKKVHDEF